MSSKSSKDTKDTKVIKVINNIKRFEDVRNWSTLRGIGADRSIKSDKKLQTKLQMAFQRVQQEITEIHEAIVLEDWEEFRDAIGDSIITLINIAKIRGDKAEDCLEEAFDVIELRKGLTTPSGSFVRYNKLSAEEKTICDNRQGNPGDQYFLREDLEHLTPEDFKV